MGRGTLRGLRLLRGLGRRAGSVHPHALPAVAGDPRGPRGGRLIAIYLVLFSLVLVRHVLRLGYLSDRHMLTLVAVSIPWAAAGTFVCARGIAVTLGWGHRRARAVGAAALARPDRRRGSRSS